MLFADQSEADETDADAIDKFKEALKTDSAYWDAAKAIYITYQRQAAEVAPRDRLALAAQAQQHPEDGGGEREAQQRHEQRLEAAQRVLGGHERHPEGEGHADGGGVR